RASGGSFLLSGLAAEDLLKEVVKVTGLAEDLLKVEAATRRRTSAAVLANDAGPVGVEVLGEALLAELVVERALLRVAEDLVRLVDLLEALLVRLPRVLVRVVLRGELAERLLDGVLVGVLRNTQHGVEVLGHDLESGLVVRLQDSTQGGGLEAL